MSAESGIETFRNSGGLWEQHKIEDVATPEAWERQPHIVQEFYNMRRKQILEANPNLAHILIAELEKINKITVITQNIDDLHERAGSTDVLHLHGNIRFSKSSGPNQEKEYYPIEGWELKMTDRCPEGYILRPHVVWFGEAVPMYDQALPIIKSADVFIVIGTSLNVYPAAGLIHYCSDHTRKYLIDPNANELNLPRGFELIAMGAEKGMEYLKNIL